MALPTSIEVKVLDEKHPDYAALQNTWEEIDLLYRDGAALKAQASRFIKKKGREMGEVYAARLARFTSRPVLGTALGWYQAAMFANDPQVSILRDDKTVKDDPFYTKFAGDCDGAGKKLVDFARDVFLSLLKFRSSFVLTDRPAVDREYKSRGEQQAAGALDAHLVRYEPSQVVNWECDDQGNLEWILLYTVEYVRSFPGDNKTFDRWYYFDREQCALYEAERKDNNKAEHALLVQGYPRPHALSAAKRVPVRRIDVPDGLWLGNRAYLGSCTYLDNVNALDWGLFNACLATLWIKGEYKDDVNRTEVGYIQLDGENGEIGYLEPAGTSFELALQNVRECREEIYRQLYLQAQGRSTDATPASQSGYSKEMDMAPSKDVLNGLGDALRTGLTGVLQDVADSRLEKDLTFTVKGLEFSDNDQDVIDRDEAFLGVRLGDTVEKEIKKRLASKALKDSDPAVIATALAEIDAMPTDAEAEKADLQTRVMAGFRVPSPA